MDAESSLHGIVAVIKRRNRRYERDTINPLGESENAIGSRTMSAFSDHSSLMSRQHGRRRLFRNTHNVAEYVKKRHTSIEPLISMMGAEISVIEAIKDSRKGVVLAIRLWTR